LRRSLDCAVAYELLKAFQSRAIVQAVCYWPFTARVWVRFQAFYVRYVVDEVALGQVLLEYVYILNYSFIGHLIMFQLETLYSVFQEDSVILLENVPWVKLHR